MVARQAPTVKPRKCEALEPKNLLSYVLVSTGSDFPSSHRAKETHRGPGLRHLRSIHRRLPYGVKVLLGCQLRVCCSLGLGGQTARCTQHQLHRPSRIVLVYSLSPWLLSSQASKSKASLPLQAEGKKLALDHFVFAASRENYSEIAANCGVNLGLNKTSPAGDDRTSRLYSSLVSEVSQDSAQRTWCDSIDQLLDQQLDVLIISAAQLQTLLSKDLPC